MEQAIGFSLTDQAKSMLERDDLTLNEILYVFQLMDDGAELSPEEMENLKKRAGLKVDAYKEALDDAVADKEKFDRKAKEWQRAKATAQNKERRIKEFMTWNMTNNNFEKLSGEDYQVTLTKTKAIKFKTEPDARMAIRYPEYIATSYKWKGSEMKKKLLEGDSTLSDVAEIETNLNPRFSVKKGNR